MSRRQNASDGPDRSRPAWIKVIPEGEADGELAALYDELRSPQTERVDHVMAIHSLHPQSMRDHQQLYQTLMYWRGRPHETRARDDRCRCVGHDQMSVL